MLTLKYFLRASKQMASYGETGTGALDHLPSRVAGHRQTKKQKQRKIGSDESPARKWDDKRKMFVYPE